MIPTDKRDWHEADRRYLLSLRDMALDKLRALQVRKVRTYDPQWERVALEREIRRRLLADHT